MAVTDKHVPQRGLTLIELIIAIVVLGIAATGILSALSRTTVLNVDPLLRVQSQALAESVMEEILARPFYRPDEDPTLDGDITVPELYCDNPDTVAKTSVCDYNGLTDTDVLNVDGYSLNVTVSPVGTGDLTGVAADCAVAIKVAVTGPSDVTTRLNAYRTSYWAECGA